MCPSPPSSSDGPSLPPRHRPSLDDLARDTTELDLWAFDDDPEMDEVSPVPTRQGSAEIPAPRNPQPRVPKPAPADPLPESSAPPHKLPQPSELIRINVNKPKLGRPSAESLDVPKSESRTNDRYQWEDLPADVEIEMPPPAPPVPFVQEMPPATPPPAEPLPVAPPEPVVAAAVPAPEPLNPAAPDPTPRADEDEFSPSVPQDATPISLRPHLGLSKIERISLFSLLLVLVASAVVILTFSLSRLPTKPAFPALMDFPIAGKHVSIVSAETYWRAPVIDGPRPDTVRRGTALMPVIEMKLGAATGNIRVLFRNESGQPIGDNLTRVANPNETLVIHATAGFDDPGMHAAYRTDKSKMWKVEVFELPAGEDAGGIASKLFEMEVSPLRR